MVESFFIKRELFGKFLEDLAIAEQQSTGFPSTMSYENVFCIEEDFLRSQIKNFTEVNFPENIVINNSKYIVTFQKNVWTIRRVESKRLILAAQKSDSSEKILVYISTGLHKIIDFLECEFSDRMNITRWANLCHQIVSHFSGDRIVGEKIVMLLCLCYLFVPLSE